MESTGSTGSPQPDEAPVPQEAPPPPAPPAEPPAAEPPPPAAASASPAWMANLTSTAPQPGPAGLFYADIPNRAIAYIIDSIILFVAFVVVGVVLAAIGLSATSIDLSAATLVTFNPIVGLVLAAINLAISVAYFVYTWTAMRGTIGMKVLGMQIGNAGDGSTISMDQALRRALILFGPGAVAQALTGMPLLGLLLGLAALAWFIFLLYTTATSPTKQGFHDKFAGTMVVKAARSVA